MFVGILYWYEDFIMSKLSSPYSSKIALTKFQKLSLVSVRTKVCKHCNSKFGVSWLKSFLIFLIMSSPMIINGLFNYNFHILNMLLLGSILAYYFYLNWLPLIKK